MPDQPQNATYRPVTDRLRKTIEDALTAEFPDVFGKGEMGKGKVGRIPVATTHVKFPGVDLVNVIASNELKPLKSNQ
jgi:hypothetical protein